MTKEERQHLIDRWNSLKNKNKALTEQPNTKREMKKGIITNRWNLVQEGQIVAQCFANTLYEASIYFENQGLKFDLFKEIEIDKTFNTKEK